MPFHFSIDPAARLVTYVVEGDPSRREAREFFDTVLSHPDFERGFHFLGDRRGAVRAPTSAYMITIVDELNGRRRPALAPCRWAMLVADEAALGMVRMLGTLTTNSGVEIRPFHTVEDAVAWLGLPADYPPPRAVPDCRGATSSKSA